MLDRIRRTLDDRADKHVGLLAEFSDPGALYDAVKSLRKQGYTRLDTFSPFPIHGMDAAMGLPVSKLGFIVFIGGATGAFLGWFMQYWMSAVDYPINISNKPFLGLEASVPIIFELTILFSALTAVGAMLALNGLPRPYNPLFNSERFGRVTDDAFFLHVAGADANYDASGTASALFEAGALAVERVDHEGATEVDASGQPLAVTAEPTGEPVLTASEPASGEAVTPSHTTGEI